MPEVVFGSAAMAALLAIAAWAGGSSSPRTVAHRPPTRIW